MIARACLARIFSELEREELRFVSTLEKGEAMLDELLSKATAADGGARVRHACISLVCVTLNVGAEYAGGALWGKGIYAV